MLAALSGSAVMNRAEITAAPKVSVCVITYNHEKYIRRCLQSIVDQRTNFRFDVFVGDDCSSDDTRKIISEFADRYPDMVFPIFNDRKIGGTQNYVSTHSMARGEYIAHVDGDDLAYPGKLQRQADYLDTRPDLVLVWHVVNVFDDAGASAGQMHRCLAEIVDPAQITLGDVLRFGSLGAASSVMYRHSVENHLAEISTDTLDFYFAARLLEYGNGARLDELLGGYRCNPAQATLSKTRSPYFSRSPMRSLLAAHLAQLLRRNMLQRDAVFLNAVFNLCVELRFLRPSGFDFFWLALRTFSISAARQLPDYFVKAFRLRLR